MIRGYNDPFVVFEILRASGELRGMGRRLIRARPRSHGVQSLRYLQFRPFEEMVGVSRE